MSLDKTPLINLRHSGFKNHYRRGSGKIYLRARVDDHRKLVFQVAGNFNLSLETVSS